MNSSPLVCIRQAAEEDKDIEATQPKYHPLDGVRSRYRDNAYFGEFCAAQPILAGGIILAYLSAGLNYIFGVSGCTLVKCENM